MQEKRLFPGWNGDSISIHSVNDEGEHFSATDC